MGWPSIHSKFEPGARHPSETLPDLCLLCLLLFNPNPFQQEAAEIAETRTAHQPRRLGRTVPKRPGNRLRNHPSETLPDLCLLCFLLFNPSKAYFPARQNRWTSPRRRRRSPIGTGVATMRSPIGFSPSNSNFSPTRTAKTTPSSRAA